MTARRIGARRGAAALAATALAVAGCGGSGGGGASHATGAVELVGRTTSISFDSYAARPVAQAESAFAVDLLHRLSPPARGNVAVSPASLDVALSMLAGGADGQTLTELEQVLHSPAAALNTGWQALTQAWDEGASDGSYQLSSANAAWLQRGFPVRQSYLDTLKSYYDTGVWAVDFAQHMPDALAAINRWTSQHTAGKIPALFDQLDPATVLVLADAVYFKAAWESAFDPDKTAPGQFTVAPGTTVSAQFMNNPEAFDLAASTPAYTAVQLPYRGERFAALAIMPKGQPLTSYLATLTPSGIAGVAGALKPQAISLSLPKFTTRSTLGLDETLAALGMPSAFNPSAANFAEMTSQHVFVGQVLQRVYLAVAEKGTEAAAATGIGITASAAPAPGTPVVFDHPFLFLIRDTQTGAILFAAEVNDPTAG